MEAALAPLGHGVLAVHGGLPAYLEALHEGFEELQVDDVIFDDQDVDGWDAGTVEHPSGHGG